MNTFLILNILHVINDGLQASMILLLPFLTNEFHLTLTEAGLLGSSLNSLHIIMAIPAGFLAIRFGGMKMLLVALFLSSLGFIGLSFGPIYVICVVLFFLSGTGFGLFHPIAFSLLSKQLDRKTLGKSMGTFTAIGDVGRIGLGAVITFFVVAIGWRISSLIYGIGACLFFIFFIIKPAAKKITTSVLKDVHTRHSSSIKRLMSNQTYIMAVITGSLDSFASSALFVFLPFLLQEKGINPSLLGSFTAVFFVGNLLGKFGLGSIIDKTSKSKVFVMAELFMAALIVGLVWSHSIYAIIGCSIALGMLTKGTVPVVASMIAVSFRDGESHEVGYSVNAIFNGIALTAAPILLGMISDAFGINRAFYVSSLFAVLATVPIIVMKLFSLHINNNKHVI
jgi:MFS transporter, FSR family, fosmidomycin resistance protein